MERIAQLEKSISKANPKSTKAKASHQKMIAELSKLKLESIRPLDASFTQVICALGPHCGVWVHKNKLILP
jgi:hypothetical protein